MISLLSESSSSHCIVEGFRLKMIFENREEGIRNVQHKCLLSHVEDGLRFHLSRRTAILNSQSLIEDAAIGL